MVNYAVPAGGDDAAAIAVELRERLKGELATSVIDFIPIRHGGGESGSARGAGRRRTARQRGAPPRSCSKRAGLDAVSLDVGPAALARLVSFVNAADDREPHPNVLLINFGSVRSHLSVVWGRRLILDRAIEIGERSLLERLTRDARRHRRDRGADARGQTDSANPAIRRPSGDAAELARTLAEVLRPDFSALVGEINKTLVYTASQSRGRGIDRIYLLGSVGRYRGIGHRAAAPARDCRSRC